MSIADLRKEYSHASLSEANVHADPMTQFAKWFDEAVMAKVPEPNAMGVTTVGANGRPSSRIMLIKGFDQRGFTWFTNYESRKGRELLANQYAALLFHWIPLERQVRIEGRVERVSAAPGTLGRLSVDTGYHGILAGAPFAPARPHFVYVAKRRPVAASATAAIDRASIFNWCRQEYRLIRMHGGNRVLGKKIGTLG
jgi:general stress protein 26